MLGRQILTAMVLIGWAVASTQAEFKLREIELSASLAPFIVGGDSGGAQQVLWMPASRIAVTSGIRR